MDKLKQWVTLTLVGCLAIMAAGWFLVVSPKRAEAAGLRAQAAEQLSANSQLETELQVLQAQAKELPKEQAKLAAVAAKLPADPALPSLVRALLEASTTAGVELASVAPGVPELVAPVAPAPVEPPATGQATTPAPPAAGTPAAPGAAPAPSAAGTLAKIPVSVTVFGDYFEVQQFMAALETLPRAVRVEGLTLSPGQAPTVKEARDSAATDGSSLNTVINGFVYMAADRPAATAATVPGAPGAPADAAAAPAAAATTATPAG